MQQQTRNGGGAVAREGGDLGRLSVGIVLSDKFTLSAFSLFVDCLRLASDEGDRSRQRACCWQVMGGLSAPARASCGVDVSCTLRYPDPSNFDYLVVVGGLLGEGARTSPACDDYLRLAARSGIPLVGLCTGSFILSRVGLMAERRCCVNWFHYVDFLNEFPDHLPVADRVFVDEGDRITCAGGVGVAAVAGHLIERHLGRALAQKSAHVLLAGQSEPTALQPLPPLMSSAKDPRVGRALLIMEQNLANPLPISEIADWLSLSQRQLERLFGHAFGLSPGKVYHRLRLQVARHLLQTTRNRIYDVAIDTGFVNASHFSKCFKRAFGQLPRKGRRRPPLDQPRESLLVGGRRLFA